MTSMSMRRAKPYDIRLEINSSNTSLAQTGSLNNYHGDSWGWDFTLPRDNHGQAANFIILIQ